MPPTSDTPPRFEMGVRIRFLASFLLQACLVAYALAGWLDVDRRGIALLMVAAGLNLGAFALARNGPAHLVRIAHRASPIWGVTTWALLTHWTGGAQVSLFVVGLWFEVLLATVGHSPRGIAVLTLASTAALWIQELSFGISDAIGRLSLQSSFLVLFGLVGARIRRSWERSQARISNRFGEQQARLVAIERKLEDAQNLAVLGAQTAKIGHALKNAVHNLRGFTALIERRNPTSPNEQAELDGLKAAIDQLEVLALESLRPAAPASAPDPVSSPPVRAPEPGEEAPVALKEVVDDAALKISRCYPGVRCRVLWGEGELEMQVPRVLLDEVLSNLLKNSAESMQQRGEVTMRIERNGNGCAIDVIDQGPGIPPDMAEHIFRPGHTSKAAGHGMGLYLARELMEAQGGGLTLGSNGAGASFRVRLPRAWEV
ncbi:MAG: signal transduction histidine kinase [Chlamydiales bacterium]|jgi:signal transduction histidine kinase